MLPEYPEDPEEWSDAQWLAWLESGAAADGTGGDGETQPPAGLVARARRSTAGAMLAGAMIAIHEVVYGEREQPAIVQEADGERDDENVRVDLADGPDNAVAYVRSPAEDPPGNG